MTVDIERLRALYEKATQGRIGKWQQGTYAQANLIAYSVGDVTPIAEVHGLDRLLYLIALHNALPAILAELERGRRIEVALVKAMDTLNDFGAYARMCGRPSLANAARIAVDASLAALEQENGDG